MSTQYAALLSLYTSAMITVSKITCVTYSQLLLQPGDMLFRVFERHALKASVNQLDDRGISELTSPGSSGKTRSRSPCTQLQPEGLDSPRGDIKYHPRCQACQDGLLCSAWSGTILDLRFCNRSRGSSTIPDMHQHRLILHEKGTNVIRLTTTSSLTRQLVRSLKINEMSLLFGQSLVAGRADPFRWVGREKVIDAIH